MGDAQHAQWIEQSRELARQYEQLIASFESHPQVAVAMSELARVYAAMRDRAARPVGDSQQRAIEWFRRVIAVSQPDSRLADDAKLRLARLLLADKTDKDAVYEARSLTESVMGGAEAHPDLVLQAKSQLVMQYVQEGDYDAAEELCRELMTWQLTDDESALRDRQLVAVNALLRGIVYHQDKSYAAKREWLDEFSKTTDQRSWLQPEVAMANRHLMALEGDNPQVPFEQTDSTRRIVLVTANLLALALVACLIWRKIVGNRRAAKPA